MKKTKPVQTSMFPTGKDRSKKAKTVTIYANDPDYGPHKQSASEKRLFKAIDTLTGKVDCMEKRFDGLASKTERKYNELSEAFEGALNNLQSKVLATTPAAKPQDYVLSEADWQRVIAEQWLCEFKDWGVSTLSATSEARGHRLFYPTNSKRCPFTHCRLLRRPGVMQPYFGQGMPCKADTKVLLKLKSGQHYMGKAVEFGWDNAGDLRDIVAWMEVV